MAEHETLTEPAPEAAHEHSTPEGAGGPATAAPENPFDHQELAQFDADDVKAGSVIGKMLSLFFLYTVIAMSLVAWWTVRSTTP